MTPYQPVTVLVVEDEAAVRRLITRMLGKCGFAVLEAGTASQGMALFHQHHERIGLVIVDMVMPGMSGLDLAAELGREHPGLRILYISGYTESVVIESLQHHAPDVVLQKPFTETALIERVTHLLHAS
jgi:two-component system cell cycle sensor histidine kinase/response regulator CckA